LSRPNIVGERGPNRQLGRVPHDRRHGQSIPHICLSARARSRPVTRLSKPVGRSQPSNCPRCDDPGALEHLAASELAMTRRRLPGGPSISGHSRVRRRPARLPTTGSLDLIGSDRSGRGSQESPAESSRHLRRHRVPTRFPVRPLLRLPQRLRPLGLPPHGRSGTGSDMTSAERASVDFWTLKGSRRTGGYAVAVPHLVLGPHSDRGDARGHGWARAPGDLAAGIRRVPQPNCSFGVRGRIPLFPLSGAENGATPSGPAGRTRPSQRTQKSGARRPPLNGAPRGDRRHSCPRRGRPVAR
jgi:hypothetical protein